MQLDPYFTFNGNCAEAMAFYNSVLGGKLEFRMTWGESPMASQVPADYQGKIMHSSLNLGQNTLMGCDAPPDRFIAAAGTQTSIAMADVEEGKRIFEKLAEGGQVRMEFQKTFWAKGFGMCIDRFGIAWMVNC